MKNIFAHVIHLNFSFTVLITHKYYVLCGNFNAILKLVVITDTKFSIKSDSQIKSCHQDLQKSIIGHLTSRQKR